MTPKLSRHTFSKGERLKSRTILSRLFKEAQSTKQYPLRLFIREAYRLQKHVLYDHLAETEPQYAFIVIYMANESLPFITIHKAMKGLLDKWLKKRNPVNHDV